MVKRSFISSLEVRTAEGSDKPCIAGYAAKFNSTSLDLGGFTERINPGCFSRSLADQRNDVCALFGHDWNQPIGRRSAGTLNIREDETGLAIEIYPDNTTWSQNALESVRSGNIRGMSFAFDVKADTWDRATKVRTLQDVDLYEVSLVSMPAYPATEASLRTAALAEITDSFTRSEPLTTNAEDAIVEDTSRKEYHSRNLNFLLRKYRSAK